MKKTEFLCKKFRPYAQLLFPNIKTLALIYMLTLVMLIREDIDSYVYNLLGDKMIYFYHLLLDNLLINIATALLCISIGITLCRLILRQNSYSWKLIISAFVIIYLMTDKNWVWAKICYFIDYKWLLITIFTSFIGCSLFHLILKIRKIPYFNWDKKHDKGFSVITKNNSMQDTGWEQYSENLIEKLVNTDIETESFAVGISGNWGSGKTTFLNTLKRKLDKRAYLVNFNPWSSDSTTQISNDFFNTLISSLTISSYNKRTVIRYANLLGQLDTFSTRTNIITSLLNNLDTSIKDAKDKVANIVASMSSPVVVVIDDLDRLDKTELMAVLRLVCVTANFKNLIFIVAYDKDYVSQMLKEVKGEEFLKKIFPLEICLPTFESYILSNHLYNELKICLGDNDWVKQLEYPIYNGALSYPISHYLPTFRDVKRFVNQFCLNVNSFIRTKQLTEINIRDLFYLELLHYYDFNAYQLILYHPKSLLKYVFNNHQRYALNYSRPNASIKENNTNNYDAKRIEILKKHKDGVEAILLVLFDTTEIDSDNLLRYPTNYAKYFSYRVNKNMISLAEFKIFLELQTKEEVTKKIKEFCQGEISKIASLKSHLISQKINTNNELQVYNISYALIELAQYGVIDYVTTFKNLFNKNKYNNIGITPTALFSAIKDQIGQKNKWVIIQKLLTALVKYTSFSISRDKQTTIYESVLSWEQLKQLAEENYKFAYGSLLKQCEQPESTHIHIENITRESSPFNEFLKMAVSFIYEETYDDESYTKTKKSLLIDNLIKIYSNINNESGLKQFFTQLEYKNDYEDNDPEWSQYNIKRNIESIFGNIDDFYSFIKVAFNNNIPNVNTHLKKLGLKEITETKKTTIKT